MSQKPAIGIAAATETDAQPCMRAVERGGGEACAILPEHPDTSGQQALSRIRALVVCGTGDAFDILLLEAALAADMPVLCVGPGMQALNVALGGKLARDVPGHDAQEKDGPDGSGSYHHIYISPGSKLAAVVGSGGFVRVNSRHRAGVREAQKSPLLLASAYSLEDGVIEALESPTHRFVIGVQFHPERVKELPPHFMRLFQSLAERAQEYANEGKFPQENPA